MNFGDLKDLCKTHDKCLETLRFIKACRQSGQEISLSDAMGIKVCLSEYEVNSLIEAIEEKGLEVENAIGDVLDNSSQSNTK